MPHAYVTSLKPLTLPTTIEGVNFSFITQGEYQLVGVNYENENFLLTLKRKDGKILVKGEKKTRPWNKEYLKKALDAFIRTWTNDLIFTNIASLKDNPPFSIEVPANYFCEHEAPQDLCVEIGFGSARHLVHQAKNRPHTQFIGIEIYKPSIRQLTRRCELDAITNIHVIDYDARTVLETLPSNSVHQIYLHFPIPWHDSPHRRVYSQQFIDESLRVLKTGGTLELRTDDEEYYTLATTLLNSLSCVNYRIVKNGDAPIISKYEARWRRMEKNIYDVILEKTEKNSDNQREKNDFKFSTNPNFDTITLLKNKLFLFDDEGLVKILEVYPMQEGFIISVILGHKERPEFKYIVVTNEQTYYYNGLPLCTRLSSKAHNLLKELLNGTKSSC